MTDSTARLSALEARLEALEARDEIRQLAARYALAADRRDAGLMCSLFAPGAVVVLPVALAGRDDGTGSSGNTEITRPADLLVPLARFGRTRHVIAQQLVEIDGDSASGVTYGEAHHLYRRAGELRDHVLALRYNDTFARTASGWRFTRRELMLDWAANSAVKS